MRLISSFAMLVCFCIVSLSGCNNSPKTTKRVSEEIAINDRQPIRAGFIYVGEIGESGWTYEHAQGRKSLEALPFVEKVTYFENISDGEEAIRTLSNLAQTGHNLIFANSFSYTDEVLAVAKMYPNVVFMQASGTELADNLGTYFGDMKESRYLTGYLAGMMTKSNIIGYVAAFPIPEVICRINSFTLGAQSVNPNVQVIVSWTHRWTDPISERVVADVILTTEADIITMDTDTPAVIQVANEKNKMSIGYNSDMSKYAPKTFLTASIWDWSEYYKYVAIDVYNGSWKPKHDMWGIKEGIVKLAPFGPMVPEEVRLTTQMVQAKLLSGEIIVFKGPIVDQNGKVRILEDQFPTIEEELNMDYFVKGIVGELH